MHSPSNQHDGELNLTSGSAGVWDGMLLPFASHGSGVGDGISLTLAQSNWLPTFQDVLTWGSNGTVNPNFLMDPSTSMNSHITMATEPMFYDGFQNMDPFFFNYNGPGSF